MKKHFPFYEARTTPIPKVDKGHTRKRKEKQLQINVLLDTKIPSRTLAHQIQQYKKRLVHQDQVGLSWGGKAGSMFENQSKSPTLSTVYRRKSTRSYQLLQKKTSEKIFNIDS